LLLKKITVAKSKGAKTVCSTNLAESSKDGNGSEMAVSPMMMMMMMMSRRRKRRMIYHRKATILHFFMKVHSSDKEMGRSYNTVE
jgi:hypothetical protein